jgi:long-chain fatty acid transport protein
LLGLAYESSPVDDEDRTIDLPFDEIYKLSASYSPDPESNRQFHYSIGGKLYFIGDAAIDQTQQGVRVEGEFDTNVILFLGGTLRYQF